MFEFLTVNSLYVVLIIALVVWLGIFLYLSGLERRLKKLEAELKNKS